VKPLVVAGVVLTLLASNAGAQSSSSASPADVARDFFAAEHDGRWLDAAHLLDLKSFEPQRARSVANARHARPEFHLTVEQLLRHNPTMPRAAAEYQVKQSEILMRDYNPLSDEYADVPTADSLAHLPVDVAAARWLEAKDPRWLIRKSGHNGLPAECEQSSGPQLKALADSQVKALSAMTMSMLTPPPQQIVAVALARSMTSGSTDSVSYVLFRDRYETHHDSTASAGAPGPEIQTSPSALTLIKTSGGWRVYPSLDFGLIHGSSFGFDCAIAIDSVKPPAKKK
jgi:hypothetical protein